MGSLEILDLFKADDYKCSLTNDSKSLAKKELREDEKTRNQALVSLRNWIQMQPHISRCRMDSQFLLRFLRTKKFSVPLTQEMLEKYLTMRVAYPQWFQKLDVLDPVLDELLTRGLIFALPEKDDLGRRVIFSAGQAILPSKHNNSDIMRTMVMTFEALLEDEENQIRGFTYIFEEKGVGLNHVAIWTPTEFQKAFTCSEKALPMRHKEVHFLHLPCMINASFELFKTFLSDKLKKRLMVHSDVTSLAKRVPRRILPKEYGGKIPMQEMIDSWKKELLKKRERLLLLDQMKVDTHMKTNGKMKEAFTLMGCEGSFRKLEID